MEKPGNSTLINVCILPDERVSTECVGISQTLKSDKTMFVLGDGLFPHMTVYMARFSNADIQKVTDATESALEYAKVFLAEHTGYFRTEGRYLEASYRKSADLLSLHELLITYNAALRINPGRPFNEGYFAPYSPEQQKNAKETGYDLARNLYRPHITLTRYREGQVPKNFPAFPQANLSFQLGRIGVYKADDNGAVYELIREFQVSS